MLCPHMSSKLINILRGNSLEGTSLRFRSVTAGSLIVWRYFAYCSQNLGNRDGTSLMNNLVDVSERQRRECPLDSLAYGAKAKEVCWWVEQSRGQPGESATAPPWQHSIKMAGLPGAGSVFLSHLLTPGIPDRPPGSSLPCHSLSLLGLCTCCCFLSGMLYPFPTSPFTSWYYHVWRLSLDVASPRWPSTTL